MFILIRTELAVPEIFLQIKRMITMKILVVEDEVQLADALTEILKRNRYAVDTVYNGIDGLDNALTGIYDCIVLDIMLPGMSGIDILRNIRNEKLFFQACQHRLGSQIGCS